MTRIKNTETQPLVLLDSRQVITPMSWFFTPESLDMNDLINNGQSYSPSGTPHQEVIVTGNYIGPEYRRYMLTIADMQMMQPALAAIKPATLAATFTHRYLKPEQYMRKIARRVTFFADVAAALAAPAPRAPFPPMRHPTYWPQAGRSVFTQSEVAHLR